jgi:hypothetical protein
MDVTGIRLSGTSATFKFNRYCCRLIGGAGPGLEDQE